MIGWLSGRVVYQLRNRALLIDVHGVGYEVHVASNELPVLDEVIELFAHTVVRKDALQLFGFRTLGDREFFELLIATPGVGPSTALEALRTSSVAELSRAIESGDAKKVATVPGIGLKTASRIVLELKGKVAIDDSYVASSTSSSPSGVVEDALRALGYSHHEVRRALDEVVLPLDESEALRTALQILRHS